MTLRMGCSEHPASPSWRSSGPHVSSGIDCWRLPLPFGTADAVVENMAYVDAAYRASDVSPR